MTRLDTGIGPYEKYLDIAAGNDVAGLGKQEVAILAENILGPKPGQDSFALVAALVVAHRTESLRKLCCSSTLLHSAINDDHGSPRYHDEFAQRFGTPFRAGETAAAHGLRALAALGLALAEDQPERRWLEAALAWYQEARNTPVTSDVSWSPGTLAGDDTYLCGKLELLATVAGPARHTTPTLMAAMTLCCLSRPTISPSQEMLLADFGAGADRESPAPARHRAEYRGIQLLPRARNPRRSAGSLTVLFDRGQDGSKARLTATIARGLPPALIPDPERMSLFAADDSFQQALGRAWKQAGQGKLQGAVLWTAETLDGPQRYASGESLSAAFAVVLDEARRLQQPLARFRMIRRLVGRNAVVGRIDDYGYMQGVEGYDAKFAALSAGRVILPEIDHQKAVAAAKTAEADIQFVPVGRWTEAASKARRASRKVLVRNLVAFLIVVIVTFVGTAVRFHDDAGAATRNADRSAAAALSEKLAAEGLGIESAAPVIARQLAAGAWTLSPTAQARSLTTSLLTEQQRTGTLPAASAGVDDVAFSPDGTLLASADADGAVRLWDTLTGQPVGPRIQAGHGTADGVTTVVFSSDGGLLATMDADGTVRLWNPRTGRQQGVPIRAGKPGGGMFDVAFSPDGALLATANQAGTIQLWDPRSGRQYGVPIQAGRGNSVYGLVFSPNGTLLATANGNGTVSLWNPFTRKPHGAPLPASNEGPETDVAFSPDGTLLAAGGADGMIRLWDTRTSRLHGPALSTDSDGVGSVMFSPDGTLLASADADGTVRLWNPLTGREQGLPLQVASQSVVNSAAFSPDGDLLATADSNGTVRLWDTRTSQPRDAPLWPGKGTDSAMRAVAFSSDGRFLATGNENGTARLWDPTTGGPVGVPLAAGGTADGGVNALAFSPDGRVLATANVEGRVQLWDTGTDRPLGLPFPAGSAPDGVLDVAFSPDGTLLATANAEGSIQFWDVRTGQPHGAPLEEGTGSAASAVAFSPDGRLLAAITGLGTVQVWNPRNGQRQGAPLNPGHGKWFTDLAFSPDGQVLATADSDGTDRLWNPFTSKPRSWVLHAGVAPSNASGVVFSPNGDLLATDDSGVVRIWDPGTGHQLGVTINTGDPNAGVSIAFSPNGYLLATTDGDGTAGLWNARQFANPYRTLCADVGLPAPATWRLYALGEPEPKTCT